MDYALGAAFVGSVASIKQDDTWNQVMERYAILRQKLREENEFPMLWKPYVITGMNSKSPDGVGYNVGKGAEIFVCTQGSVNDIFHVLLHELCHNTVTEYDHSSVFWSNLDELKRIARNAHIYTYTDRKDFCDGIISD